MFPYNTGKLGFVSSQYLLYFPKTLGSDIRFLLMIIILLLQMLGLFRLPHNQ